MPIPDLAFSDIRLPNSKMARKDTTMMAGRSQARVSMSVAKSISEVRQPFS